MGSPNVQQSISTERLLNLLRSVHEGRLLIPAAGPPAWEGERRLKLFENVYRGLPIGCITLWRTTEHLEPLRAMGAVPLRVPEPLPSGVRTYLLEGAERLTALFEQMLSEAPGELVTFDLETRTFRLRRKGEATDHAEFALSYLLKEETQDQFASTFEPIDKGERLLNRLRHLTESLFNFPLPVITLATSDTEAVSDYLLQVNPRVAAALGRKGSPSS